MNNENVPQNNLEPNPNQENKSPIPVINTYESALQDSIKRKEASKAREYIISRKEKNSAVHQFEQKKSKKTIFIILILLILAVGVYLAVKTLPFDWFKKEIVTTNVAPNALFEINEIKRISVDNKNREDLIKEVYGILAEDKENGTITSIEFFLTQVDAETEEKIELNVSSIAFFEQILGIKIPDRLLRSLDKKFIFGYFTENDTNRPFLFLLSTDFQNTFAGMLEWENNILKDTNLIFRVIPNLAQGVAETAEEIAEEDRKIALINDINTAKFKDLIIQNRDTRTLMTENGTSLMLYSFINSNMVLITNHPSVLDEINTRIRNSQLIRQ